MSMQCRFQRSILLIRILFCHMFSKGVELLASTLTVLRAASVVSVQSTWHPFWWEDEPICPDKISDQPSLIWTRLNMLSIYRPRCIKIPMANWSAFRCVHVTIAIACFVQRVCSTCQYVHLVFWPQFEFFQDKKWPKHYYWRLQTRQSMMLHCKPKRLVRGCRKNFFQGGGQ